MDKLFCCNQDAQVKKKADSVESKRNGVTTTQPEPTWRVGDPLAAGNGIGAEPVRKSEHMELTRLTSDASRLNDPKIEPDSDFDPNVIEEVSHEDLARYSSDSPFTPRDSNGPGTSNDSFHDIDLDKRDDPNTARSIEEVAREYNRSKREILEEIEREEEEVRAVITKQPQPAPVHFAAPPQTAAEIEAMKAIAADSVFGQIDLEFKEIIDEVEEESEEDLKREIEERLKASHEKVKAALSNVVEENKKKESPRDDVDSPSPRSSSADDSSVAPPRVPALPSFDDDSDVEHLLQGMESGRTTASELPPPPPHIDTTSSSSIGVAAGPLSSSSGFATSTMYSAASDDSDVSDGEQVPDNKRVFDVSSDEGTAGHGKSPAPVIGERQEATRLSLKSSGEAAVASGEIRVALPKEKSVTLTDEEFSEKLV